MPKPVTPQRKAAGANRANPNTREKGTFIATTHTLAKVFAAVR
jgi:hypothetical protein